MPAWQADNISIPKFENEDQERAYWSQQDSAEYVDWSKAEKAIFPNLKPTSKTISLRLPGFFIDGAELSTGLSVGVHWTMGANSAQRGIDFNTIL